MVRVADIYPGILLLWQHGAEKKIITVISTLVLDNDPTLRWVTIYVPADTRFLTVGWELRAVLGTVHEL